MRFQENFPDFKCGNGKYKIAKHSVENRHAIAPMENIVEVLHITKMVV
jgi:hypothetical protein